MRSWFKHDLPYSTGAAPHLDAADQLPERGRISSFEIPCFRNNRCLSEVCVLRQNLFKFLQRLLHDSCAYNDDRKLRDTLERGVREHDP